MRAAVVRFLKDEQGAEIVEVGIWLALIVAVSIVAIQTLGTTINGKFGTVNTTLGGGS